MGASSLPQSVNGFQVRYGHPLPYGATPLPEGVNFSIFSANATACTLVLIGKGSEKIAGEIPFPPEFRLGEIWAMAVLDIDPALYEYGYRFDGPHDPRDGFVFDPTKIVLDPYCREIGGDGVWKGKRNELMPFRGRIPVEPFSWEQARPVHRSASQLVIYEMHVRGFTAHPSSGVDSPGTYEAMRQKIPYLKELGVNCVELMPIFEFDELENTRTNPLTGEELCNYWGYSTLGFFAPKASYAAGGAQGKQVEELKALIHDLHEAHIEVVLDVVFNHTAEGGDGGPTLSFRGIDNSVYYMLEPGGKYSNYSGCGNTLNCNHPVVRDFVVDCLRYWASEFHIDGFRFDLASVLGRDVDGSPLTNPPLLERLAHDPVLAHCDLIAEAWDAGGLYQVGSFPSYGRWMEWNGKYRDAARRFLKGDAGVAAEMVQRVMGSPDLYATSGRKPHASINFLTCHDGFTLRDLFSYNEKHNLANGENNRDGANDNNSWNCGVEGETDNPEINALRLRLQKNAITLLFVSQGVPMIWMGDEMGRTQGGNNNTYCQDDDWNMLNWDIGEESKGLSRFTRMMIAFRKANQSLAQDEFLHGRDVIGSGYPDISWHGVEPWKPDWSTPSRTLAFMLCGKHAAAAGRPFKFMYCAFNMFHEPLEFTLPRLPRGKTWRRVVDTAKSSPNDFLQEGEEELLPSLVYKLTERSAIICIGD